MLRNPLCSRAIAVALLFIPLSLSTSFAHCFVGARFFPATLATDDPCVADEMSLPTVAWSRTTDVPPAQEWDISGELCTAHHRGFRHLDRQHLVADQPAGRFQDGRFLRSRNHLPVSAHEKRLHELAMLLGLIVDWGGTGAVNSGIGTSYSVLTPTWYVGKGFGDLPDSAGWLRAFAVTGQVGYQIPTTSYEVAQGRLHPAGARLRRIAAIQHAVPEIGDQRSCSCPISSTI